MEASHIKIGILGAGFIGATLATRLSQSGHEVAVANSRGPETIDPGVLVSGAEAVTAADVVVGVDVLITSIPFNRMSGIVSLVARTSPQTVVIDTSNYYPHRDGHVADIDEGQVESVWVSDQLGRPVAKAWNAIGAESFASKATAPGTQGRIAVPVAADRDGDRSVALQLVEETGFDAVDAGAIADSWRQQPGAPSYCTDLTRDQLRTVLASAEKDRIPRRRDLIMSVVAERLSGNGGKGDWFGDWLVQLNRAISL
ncbi:NADPH-dependent F420 reductase [Pseudonocardia xishanensis]|uniref:NAD(P)-binding domain-containing protein n=1 Tax=Pseudonocardia xishanensis TaxID=630995 RepID=A0ABP8RW86_9PSEU